MTTNLQPAQLEWEPVYIKPGIQAEGYYTAKVEGATFEISPMHVHKQPGFTATICIKDPTQRYGIVQDVELGSVQRFCSWVARAYGWI